MSQVLIAASRNDDRDVAHDSASLDDFVTIVTHQARARLYIQREQEEHFGSVGHRGGPATSEVLLCFREGG